MKNIHLLPTDKLSRLAYVGANGLCLGENFPNTSYCKPQNIYITSDEKIKEGDWVLNTNTNSIAKYTGHGSMDWWVKIILTTDKDLIKDGVQAIDDDFLEWFVKNPSCEEIEVVDYLKYFNVDELRERHLKGLPHLYSESIGYKIIIPKEEPKDVILGYKTSLDAQMLDKVEPKQETLEEAADIERIAMDKLKNKWNHLYTFGYPQRPFPTNYENDLNNIKIGLYEGAKWKSERMYSEEDLISFAEFVVTYPDKNRNVYGEMLHSKSKYDGAERTIDLLEQFKKK